MPLNEACGVLGIASKSPVLNSLTVGLRALQHRGQESAGITIYDGEHLTQKGMGLVAEVLNDFGEEFTNGLTGIGHVRYSTAGGSSMKNAQPMTVSSVTGELSIGHNGNVANQDVLRLEKENAGWAFMSDTDSEIIVRMIANNLSKNNSVIKSIQLTMKELVGSYSIVLLHQDELYAFRDPLGIKPLCLGEIKSGKVVASESSAIEIMGGKMIRDVEPGEIVKISDKEILSHIVPSPENKAFCMFEYVYFARPDAKIDGILTSSVRQSIGNELWNEAPLKADVVVPVPDSGIACALGFSEASELPYREGLIKNRYLHRSFIQPVNEQRKATISEKLNPIREIVEGKRVVLVDDSIVRGNTSKRIVARVREAGAKEVHIRVGCPPIISPCFLGIDMPSREEFIAPSKTTEEITQEIGADSVEYISIPGLVKCIGKEEKDLCLGCITESYPLQIDGERQRGQATLEEFKA
ncbi:MAG: amidophosphoribosyltransferase [Candidatus Thermoplasmatota archaeon]|nr:amidophosphoribosyltransferase [Candidatus Thermoplasmatota archaeon]